MRGLVPPLLVLVSLAGCTSPERVIACHDPTELDDVIELCGLRLELVAAEDALVVHEAGRKAFAWADVNLSAHQNVDADRRVCAAIDGPTTAEPSRCVAMSSWVDPAAQMSLAAAAEGRIGLGARIALCVAGDANLPLRIGIGLRHRDEAGMGEVYAGFTHGDLGPVRKCPDA